MPLSPRRATSLTVAAALTAALLAPATPASADGVEDLSSRATLEVVYEGLDNPRKVTWDPLRGRMLVAEAGTGGPGPCAPGVGGYPACYGASGAIFSYEPATGDSSRFAVRLPSVDNEVSVMGPHGVDVYRGQVHVAFGLAGSLSTRDGIGDRALPLGQVARVGPSSRVFPYGDLALFEEENDPHPVELNSNPYGLAVGPSGTVVADAGGNTVFHVSEHGGVEMLALIPDHQVDGGTVEAVPSGVVEGPDGAYYVSEFSAEQTSGTARVWRLTLDGDLDLYAEGFTAVNDITFDHQGRLVVLEMAAEGLESPNQTGRLVRVEPDGTHVVLASEGLEHPGGVAVAPDGDFYVTTRSWSLVSPGPGQLVRVSTDA
ncbi:hypothetical protein CQJ94_27285 [Glycomyces fuscus]|nr:hypothetical protein CQJ94_27285 [Glycomyces fuscus]